MRSLSTCICLLVCCFVLIPGQVSADDDEDRTDEVFLINGDRVTCEIKELDRGRLRIKTDSMQTVFIEWDDVDYAVSNQTLQIELTTGERALGTLRQGPTGREIMVLTENAAISFKREEVVRIQPIHSDDTFVERMEGSLALGLNFQQATDILTLFASGSSRYRTEDYLFSNSFTFNNQTLEDDENSLRADLNSTYRRFQDNRWFWTAFGSAERNDELGVELRLLAGGGYGRFLRQTNSNIWSGTLGLAASAEKRSSDDNEVNLEGIINTEFAIFRYDTPKVDLTTMLTLYPSITDPGRIRANLDIKLRREFLDDLFWELTFFESFDSDPPDDAQNSDFGIVTSLGYSF